MNSAQGEQMCCNILRHEFNVMCKKITGFISLSQKSWDIINWWWLLQKYSEPRLHQKKRSIFLISFLRAHIIHEKFIGMGMRYLRKVTHLGYAWARNSKTVGKASSWILDTMPVGFSEGQKKIVNQPVQLWECSCEIAEGNDEVEGKLIKWHATKLRAVLAHWRTK